MSRFFLFLSFCGVNALQLNKGVEGPTCVTRTAEEKDVTSSFAENERDDLLEWCVWFKDPIGYGIAGDAEKYIEAHIFLLKFFFCALVFLAAGAITIEALMALVSALTGLDL